MKTIENSDLISVAEVQERMHVSYAFLKDHLLHDDSVEKVLIAGRRYFKKHSLNEWIMDHATFERQTAFSDEEPTVPITKGDTRGSARKAFAWVPVEPFDILDLTTHVIKEYSNTELAYRDFFRRGAIKISFSCQRTCYYIPEPNGKYLVPAASIAA